MTLALRDCRVAAQSPGEGHESRCRAAEEELLERTLFVVKPAVYSKFLAMLDAPPQPNERLQRTMQTAPPYSKA
ncbi:MAG: DUF1778 domain-containing protein [Burkholderiales bacterium]